MSASAGTKRARSKGLQSTLSLIPLGSGQEVGRSCHILKFKGKTIMFDCGIHPGRKGMDSLPFFDEVDPSEVDLVLMTHFHLDHLASLPYWVTKTEGFRGRIFMTHATKAIGRMILSDYCRIMEQNNRDDLLYQNRDVRETFDRCELIDFHQEITVDGIKFTAYQAGHVLGACMFMVEIAGVRILYTGDYSREDDRHLTGAEVPTAGGPPDILVVESTYGLQRLAPRVDRERRFIKAVETVVKRGGKCLIPVFSLGRAQELLLILEEHWKQNPEMHNIPIYYASRMAEKALEVYKTYTNSMNAEIRRTFESEGNPWQFQHITNLPQHEHFEFGPAVVLASPGMLQSGVSRRLFEQWCPDAKNGVLLAGYFVEGTLAKKITEKPATIESMTGARMLPLNCDVHYEPFSAHSDFSGTFSFVQQLKPKHIVLVHGERHEQVDSMWMGKLKEELVRKLFPREHQGISEEMADAARSGLLSVVAPSLCENLNFQFTDQMVVKAIGQLAEKRVRCTGARVAGLRVSRNFEHIFVAPEDLTLYTQLSTVAVEQRLHLPFHSSFERLSLCLSSLFDSVEEVTAVDSGSHSLVVDNTRHISVHGGRIRLAHTYPPGRILMEWEASPLNDMVADSIVACVMQAEGGISAVRISHQCCRPQRKTLVSAVEGQENTREMEDDKAKSAEDGTTSTLSTSTISNASSVLPLIVHRLLLEHFPQEAVTMQKDGVTLSVHLRDAEDAKVVDADVCVAKNEVLCSDQKMRQNLQQMLRRVTLAVCPLELPSG